jgi:hypothetical protein
MLELLCGRSPPGPPPRGDSGRAVLRRPPCAHHDHAFPHTPVVMDTELIERTIPNPEDNRLYELEASKGPRE